MLCMFAVMEEEAVEEVVSAASAAVVNRRVDRTWHNFAVTHLGKNGLWCVRALALEGIEYCVAKT